MPSSDDAAGKPPSPRGQLLVVDDEPSVLRYLVHSLTRAGHQVVTATNAESALDLLRSKRCDLVVSDLVMPGMGGMELMGELRKLDPDLPVILLTGNPDLHSAMRAVELGAFRYLTKPFADDSLHETVEEGLRLHHVARLKRQALRSIQANGGHGLREVATEAALDEALDSAWMAYQPILWASSRRLFAHEALLRTRSGQLRTPDAVLGCAESLERLEDVGRKVRDLVARRMSEVELGPLFFVNVHARDLLDDTLFDPDAPLSQVASRVVLELTERTALSDVDDLPGRMARLRQLGFKLAVDDLGAGFAGLTSLTLITPEYVKIDMSLVRDVHRDGLKRNLVKSLTSACRQMGILVVAEGVEVPEERDLLADLGCDLLQGYLFGRPQAELMRPQDTQATLG